MFIEKLYLLRVIYLLCFVYFFTFVYLLCVVGIKVVTFDDWEKINEAEVVRGEALGKPREKFVDVKEMLSAVQKL